MSSTTESTNAEADFGPLRSISKQRHEGIISQNTEKGQYQLEHCRFLSVSPLAFVDATEDAAEGLNSAPLSWQLQRHRSWTRILQTIPPSVQKSRGESYDCKRNITVRNSK